MQDNIPSRNAPEPDVVVRVRRRIVQIQREEPSVRGVVPIAPAYERLKSRPSLKFN